MAQKKALFPQGYQHISKNVQFLLHAQAFQVFCNYGYTFVAIALLATFSSVSNDNCCLAGLYSDGSLIFFLSKN